MARRLFLQRRTYRQNRLQDAARLLPILGVLLFFAPIFIRDADTMTDNVVGTGLENWLVYYFTVWILLIALTAVVSRALIRLNPDHLSEPDADRTDPATAPPAEAEVER